MSLPKLDTQGSLFESLGSVAGNLFSDQDKYKLFATKIWPLLAKSREELASCYVLDNGRPGIEPIVLLGVLIFQFLERVPDRQAAELVKYHLGWKLALNLDLNFKGIHHTSLSYFRERLLETAFRFYPYHWSGSASKRPGMRAGDHSLGAGRVAVAIKERTNA
jgi:Transposase domain (DUF772)